MNKRIKKKKESFSYEYRYNMTLLIYSIVACNYYFHYPDIGIEPQGYIRWRGYYKKYNLNKRNTLFNDLRRNFNEE
jgi:hypothetical protein